MTAPQNSELWQKTLSRRDLIKLGLIASVAPRSLFAADAAWSFAVFSDTHYGVAGNEEKNRVMLQEILTRSPELAIDAGDLTERAWPEEFDQAKNAFGSLPFKVYVAPGNHDVRWAPRGLTMFTERVAPPHQLFMHKGCAFLLLDSTVPLSHWGHIGSPQIAWIHEQMKQVPPETPLFVFQHHAGGRGGGIDDGDALAEALNRYNTKVIFTGHGHADLLWDWNGVTATMGKGLYQGSYQIATVDPDAREVRVMRGAQGSAELTPLATVSLLPRTRPTMSTARPQNQRSANNVLRPAWQQSLGGGVMSHLLLHDDTLYVSGMDGVLYAFAAKDGKQRWQARTGGYCFSSPVIASNTVIVGSADGYAYAFDREHGREKWRVKTNGPVYGSAAVAKGVAAIASGDGVVYGIDMKSGNVRWRFTLPPGPSAFSQSPATTDGERVFIGAWDENVYALDMSSGAEVWRYRATERGFYFSAAIGKPALYKSNVIIPANENALHCIDAATGKRVWMRNAVGDKFGYSSPTIVGDRIYIGALGDKGEVRCLSADTGADIWTTATGSTIYESSPAVAGTHVSIGSVDGTLSLLNASDGTLLDRYRFPPGLFVSSPAAAKGRVYAATFAEVVTAFDVVEAS